MFWSIQLDDVLVDGNSTNYCNIAGANCLITPDSGTSAITFPSPAFKKFDDVYGDEISCSETDILNFGHLTFVIEGDHYNLPSHHWVRRDIDESDELGGKCKQHINALDVHQPGLKNLFIAGDLFMQLYFTVFDRDEDRVGLAHAHHTESEQLISYDQKGYLATVDTLSDYAY